MNEKYCKDCWNKIRGCRYGRPRGLSGVFRIAAKKGYSLIWCIGKYIGEVRDGLSNQV